MGEVPLYNNKSLSRSRVSKPEGPELLSSEDGTYRIVQARLWPWLSDESPQDLASCFLFVRQRLDFPAAKAVGQLGSPIGCWQEGRFILLDTRISSSARPLWGPRESKGPTDKQVIRTVCTLFLSVCLSVSLSLSLSLPLSLSLARARALSDARSLARSLSLSLALALALALSLPASFSLSLHMPERANGAMRRIVLLTL